jgi:hypothetical protein
MKNHPVIPAVFALAALLMVPQAGAEQRHVSAQNVYVRANPHGFFIGTLFNGESFNRSDTSGFYAWGFAAGSYQGCGWVETAATVAGGSSSVCNTAAHSTIVSGADSRKLLLASVASKVNDYIPGRTLPMIDGGSIVRVRAGVITSVFGNYRHGRALNIYGPVDASVPFAWRWVSADGRTVAVNAYPGESRAAWMFIPRNALPAQLPYSDGVWR